jgi:acetyl-CoA carboxylase carboxyl transferase subunit beta
MTATLPVAPERTSHAGRDEVRWIRCTACGLTVYAARLARALDVCPECGHHRRIGAEQRIAQLVDLGSWSPSEVQPSSVDPLGFVDVRLYPERLAAARLRTGLEDAARYGTAAVGGHPVVMVAMDFRFLGGSMGSAVGEAVTRAAETALASRRPLVVVATSGGARMQEGALSLMQMAKTAQAMRALQQGGVLSVCVLADPTFGGVTASFAALGDVLVAEQGALIGFAGPGVIANATREQLPAGFQTAEYLRTAGLVDRVEPRGNLRPLLIRLLDVLAGVRDGRPPAASPALYGGAAAVAQRPPTATLAIARDIARPTTLDYLALLCDEFVELHGDRTGADDAAIIGGPARLGGRPVMVIGHQKGHDTAELVARGFGMAGPAGYRKVLRLARLAERLGLPVVTMVDTQGAAPGVDAERNGQAWAIAECIAGFSELGVPVVSIVTGEGGSGGALALATANTVLMLENACYSVISPESCSVILHGDASRTADMAAALRITAPELVRMGIVDGVVPEPPGGAQADPAAAADALAAAVGAALDRLSGLSAAELRKGRHERFRTMGVSDDV